MSDSVTSRRARALALDAHVVAAMIDPAENNLDTAFAGWPTSTPGADQSGSGQAGVLETCDAVIGQGVDEKGSRGAIVCGDPLPCRTHSLSRKLGKKELGHVSTKSSSIVERTANTDRAREDLDELREHIRKAAHHMRRAAKISVAWGTAQLGKSEVARRLDEIVASLWCVNCAKQGRNEIRMEGGSVRCEFCQKYHDRWKDDPTKRIFDCKQSRGGKLYESDVIRIRAEEKAEAAERKKAEKAKVQAERRKAAN